MADRNLADLHPDMLPLCQKFLAACQAAGLSAFVTQTYRSSAEQDADFAQGRTAPGPIITNARGGQSKHNFTLDDGTPASKAFDFAIRTDDGNLDWDPSDPQWQSAIRIGESLGLVSGSEWKSIKDAPHMELAEAPDDESATHNID